MGTVILAEQRWLCDCLLSGGLPRLPGLGCGSHCSGLGSTWLSLPRPPLPRPPPVGLEELGIGVRTSGTMAQASRNTWATGLELSEAEEGEERTGSSDGLLLPAACRAALCPLSSPPQPCRQAWPGGPISHPYRLCRQSPAAQDVNHFPWGI